MLVLLSAGSNAIPFLADVEAMQNKWFSVLQ
jgi:hypothetical protein